MTRPSKAQAKLTVSEQLSGLFDGTVTEELVSFTIGSSFAMHFPDMVLVGDTVYAYYISYPAGYEGRPCIGFATSKDGLSFERVSDSVIVAGSEDWDARIASFASVWYENGLFTVVYEATPSKDGANIGYATSKDGIHFEKQGILLEMDKSSDWQNYNIGISARPICSKKTGSGI